MLKFTVKELESILGKSNATIRKAVKQLSKEEVTEKEVPIKDGVTKLSLAVTESGMEKLKEKYGITDNKVSKEDKNLLGELKLELQGDFLGTKCDFYKDQDNNIYMTRKQIAEALEYSEGEKAIKQIHQRNDDLESMSVEISEFLKGGCQSDPHLSNISGGLQKNTLLYNEDGVYEITFLSRQPKASDFREWVRERIKEIRKFGFTTQTNKDGSHNIEVMTSFLFGEEETAGTLAFKKLAHDKIELMEQVGKQKDLISALEPKAEIADLLISSKDNIDVNAMSKLLSKNGIDMGHRRLLKWLRDNEMIMYAKVREFKYNIPTQRAINSGLLKLKENVFVDTLGEKRVSLKTLVTPKGQKWLLNKFGLIEEK